MDRKVFYNGTILTMQAEGHTVEAVYTICLLYTSDAADD